MTHETMQAVVARGPSALIAAALRLPPLGNAGVADTTCAMCGTAINVGDLCVSSPFGKDFTDHLSLAARTNTICGHCASVTRGELLSTSGDGSPILVSGQTSSRA